MARTLDQVLADLPAGRRRSVRKRANELIAEEFSLRELRRALQLTQTDVAGTLGKRQDEVSRIEQRGDLLLSTLNDYVRSLGGELELVCTFKDRRPVRIRNIARAAGGQASRRPPRARGRAPV